MPDSTALQMVDAVQKVGPALSATSDLPENPPPPPAPEPEPKPDTGTGPDKPGEETPSEKGDETGTETPGEAVQPKTDETPPHLKAQISRWKNRAAEAEKRFETLMTTVERLTKSPPAEPKAEPPKTPDEPRPRRESFDSPDAYETALDGWHAKQRDKAIKDAVSQFKVQTEEETRTKTFNEIRDKWTERRDAFASKHEDYAEVVDNDAVPITQTMTSVIVQLENGPELAYHLGKNPSVAERISKLPPAMAVYELGKVAATLAVPEPKVSKAPPPIKPLGSRASAAKKTPDEMSMDEYGAYRKEQERAKWREQHGMVNGQTH